VRWKSKYNIEFKGLKEGLHDYEFEVDDKFFVHFEESLVEKGNAKVKVTLEKRSTFLTLHFNIKGWLELTCDRCLELYQQKIKNKAEIFVKFGEQDENEEDSVLWILPEEHNINLAQLIYEYVSLSIPLRHVHPKNKDGKRGCNTEMIDKLKNFTNVGNSNKEMVDPRWAALEKLKNQQN
jgi:uncharacterized metal-binding protein YceD (DUF177 family)